MRQACMRNVRAAHTASTVVHSTRQGGMKVSSIRPTMSVYTCISCLPSPSGRTPVTVMAGCSVRLSSPAICPGRREVSGHMGCM